MKKTSAIYYMIGDTEGNVESYHIDDTPEKILDKKRISSIEIELNGENEIFVAPVMAGYYTPYDSDITDELGTEHYIFYDEIEDWLKPLVAKEIVSEEEARELEKHYEDTNWKLEDLEDDDFKVFETIHECIDWYYFNDEERDSDEAKRLVEHIVDRVIFNNGKYTTTLEDILDDRFYVLKSGKVFFDYNR